MSEGILYLPGDAVVAAMPPIDERLDLAARTMVALVADAELPPKIGVHPRPEGSFAHAMPAALRPARPDATTADDLLGIKWVTGVPDNRSAGLPPINALVILSDPATGRPTAILDGGPITSQRTAAVSGVIVRQFAPSARRVAIIGSGVQGHSHAEMLAGVLPGTELVIHDRDAERAAGLAATSALPATVAASARAAVADADLVISAATFAHPKDRQQMTGDWLRDDAVVIPVDYATMCAADVARDATLFLTDDIGQFVANRDLGQFDDYPDPAMSIGEALIAGTTRPATGRVVATHLGVGLADLVFADAIVTRARGLGLGTWLPR